VSNPAIEPDSQSALRLRALARLTGRADAADVRATSGPALSVLYELASSPTTAADALALLHEIQVHQVEVELQDEELRRSRVELEASLARQLELYELAPFAYFTLDGGTAIRELNLAAARLLGADRESLLGRRLDQLLAPESGGRLKAMLADIRAGAPEQAGALRLADDRVAHVLQASVKADSTGERFLVALVDAGEAAKAQSSPRR
jgi:PAS domain S-box-containing protein